MKWWWKKEPTKKIDQYEGREGSTIEVLSNADRRKMKVLYNFAYPICGKNVIVASLRYPEDISENDTNFHYYPTKLNELYDMSGPSIKCEVIIPASRLLKHLEDECFSYGYGQVKMNYLLQDVWPEWLRNRDSTIERPVNISRGLANHVRSHLEEFIEEGDAQFYCYECEETHHEIDVKYINLNYLALGSESGGLVEWYCPQGHNLRREWYSFHVFRRASPS